MADSPQDSQASGVRVTPEPQLTITLPLSAWSIVTAHLQVGAYNTVAAVISSIAAQACPQIEAAQRAEAAEQARLAKADESVSSAARAH